MGGRRKEGVSRKVKDKKKTFHEISLGPGNHNSDEDIELHFQLNSDRKYNNQTQTREKKLNNAHFHSCSGVLII